MSDKKRWFKLWENALDDPALGELSLDDWARWAMLGVFTAKHGCNGQLTVTGMTTSICRVLRVSSIAELIGLVKRLPNVSFEIVERLENGHYKSRNEAPVDEEVRVLATRSLEEAKNETLKNRYTDFDLSIKFKNWYKYQCDNSLNRVRIFREKTRKCNGVRGEEKRGEEKRREERYKPPQVHPPFRGGAPPEVDPGSKTKAYTSVQLVILGFKKLADTPISDKGWDRVYFRRYARVAAELLNYFGGDWRKAVDCEQWVIETMKKLGRSYTLETVLKHAHEYKNQILPQEEVAK